MNIHNLDYKLYDTSLKDEGKYILQKPYEQLFPAMPGKFLIRAYAPIDNNNNCLMIEEVVSNDVDKTTIFHQEVWFRE